MLKRTLTLLIAIAMLPPILAATRQVDETIEVDGEASITLELVDGRVRFVAWDRSRVKIEGVVEISRHRDDDSDDVMEIDVDEGDVEIEIDYDDDRRRAGDTDLTIHFPAGAEVEVETIAADISVEGATGGVSVESISGDIGVEGDPVELSLESVAGRIEVDSSGSLESGEFETVSGDMDLRLDPGPRMRVSVGSVNGDIVLRLPADVSAEFSFETFSGSIDNDFGPAARKTSEFLPAKTLEFTAGSGDARIVGESFNGRIKLVRR